MTYVPAPDRYDQIALTAAVAGADQARPRSRWGCGRTLATTGPLDMQRAIILRAFDLV